MYPQYRFMFIPIIVGAFGWVPKSLKDQLQCLGINDIDSFTWNLKVFIVCLVQWKYFELFWSLNEIILSLWAWVSVCGWLVLASQRPIFLSLSSQLVGAPRLAVVTSYPLLSSCDWPDLLATLILWPFESRFPSPSWVYQFFYIINSS